MTTLLSIFFLFFAWSLSFPIGKMMLSYAPPIFLTGIRMFIASIGLVGFSLITKKFKALTKRILISLCILGFFNIYLTNILEFWSLSQISAAKTCFLYSLTPFIAALLSYIHFREKMTPLKWVGLSIGFMGFLPTIFAKDLNELSLGSFLGFSLPEIAMFFAVVFSSYGWVLLRLLVKDEVSPLIANGVSMLIGGLLALGTSFFIDSWTPLPIATGSFGILFGLILTLTLLSNVFCYNLYGHLLKKYTATFLSLFGLLSPIFASLHAWILLGEVPHTSIFLSTLIIVIGLTIVYNEERKQGYFATKTEK